MELSIETFSLTPDLLSQLCDFRDWLKTEDYEDGSSYDEARMLCRDFRDYLNGTWQTTPERATEVLVSRMHDLVFTLNRHGFATTTGAEAEEKLRAITNFLHLNQAPPRPL